MKMIQRSHPESLENSVLAPEGLPGLGEAGKDPRWLPGRRGGEKSVCGLGVFGFLSCFFRFVFFKR